MVGCLVPEEGLWVFVVVLDEGSDGFFEFSGGAVDAAPELFFGERGEPAFHR